MELFEAVRRLRKLSGLSQQKFATRIGMGLNAVQRWEGGEAQPSVSGMVALQSLAIELGDLKLASTFAFGPGPSTKVTFGSLMVEALQDIQQAFMGIEMRLTQCVADETMTEFQRGRLVTEALQVAMDHRSRVSALIKAAAQEPTPQYIVNRATKLPADPARGEDAVENAPKFLRDAHEYLRAAPSLPPASTPKSKKPASSKKSKRR